MPARVIVPWLPGCPHRARAWRYVRQFYRSTPTIALGGDPWCKADPVMRAVSGSSARVIVVADGDVFCDGLDEAIGEVEAGAAWAVPHSHVHRLTEQGTENVLNGQPWDAQEPEQPPYLGYLGGGYVVAHREVLQSIPLDRRFVGWGHEDESLGMALTCLVGPPWRGHAPLVHLWHPPQPRLTRARGTSESWALRCRYRRARHDPKAMRQLIEEGRGDNAAHQSSSGPCEAVSVQ